MTDAIRRLLHRGCRAGVFSGAAWSCGTARGVVDAGLLGTVAAGGPPVSEETRWDLASVTKPIVALAIMSLVETGDLALDDAIGSYLDDLVGPDKAGATVRQLLTHTSGLPGEVPFFRWCPTRAALLAALRDVPLRFPPGTGIEYSSAGFMLLGLVAERASGRALDRLVAQRVCEPLGMAGTGFGVPEGLRAQAAATEQCAWRRRVVQGTVHDENAEVLGGVAGHAGMFTTRPDLQTLATHLCRIGHGERGVVAPATLAAMIAPATDGLPLRRGLGWHGRDAANCPAGDLVGPRSYGHTGFTGTSIWLDPDHGSYAILLTNRVHPTRADRGFAAIRARFHTVAAALTSGAG